MHDRLLQEYRDSIKSTGIFLVLFLCFITHYSSAQQTANHVNNWYFGTSVGMTFNGGAPVNIPSSITAYEVTANYSDGDGNVLFYAGATSVTAYGAGFTVWDASHTTMPNGDVAIDHSTSCGLTAVPVPGNCDQYYIFALSALGGTNYGLRSSVIDMTLPGNGTIPLPLGDVVVGQKDLLIFNADTLAEKIKVVQQGNTENFWVITRSLNNDLFYSFEVTSGGVNPIPVVSTISATNYPTPTGSPIVSWLAVNKDRDIIAEANGFGPEVKVYDFDNVTGILSLGEVVIPTGTFGTDIPYGVEFSASGNALYVNWYEGGNNTYISSFDMTAGFGSIGPTRQDFLIATGSAQYGAMVKASDGKIYSTRFSTTQLTVINDPNNYLVPNITNPGYSPGPGASDIGMPNITYYYHPDNFIDTLAGNDRTICANYQATVGAIGYDSIWATYSWEPALMVADPGNAVTQTVALTADQEFIVHVITACGDTLNSDTTMVLMGGVTPTIFTPNSWYCTGDNLTPIVSDIGSLWFDDITLLNQVAADSFFIPPSVLGVSTYYVVDTTGGCISTAASIDVEFADCPDPCATNLFSNLSFETYSQCPTGPSQLDYATGWLQVQTSSNDYFNCAYFGHPSGITFPPITSASTGMFYNPTGTGYVGMVIEGTGIIAGEGFGQQMNLAKCADYTLQFRAATDNTNPILDNGICVYGSNVSTTPGTGCMDNYDLLACLPANEFNLNWNVHTVSFTPTQDYTYIAISGACPSTGTNAIGGYLYLDDMFLCEDLCANMATVITPIEVTPELCTAADGSGTVDLTYSCYTNFDFSWEDAANPGPVVSTDSIALGLSTGDYNVT
ncbi:MAG: hypothetical protein HRT57_00990, partial [Crocinitomicaceae bacterium]|nr:hypothetical protein [Crocinitomicaceae bacterium]